MAKLTYSASNKNSDAFESFFLLQAAPNNLTATSTAATVTVRRLGAFQGDAVFNHVLTDGTTGKVRVHSFALSAPAISHGNPTLLLTFDADPTGNGSIATNRSLQTLHQGGTASAAVLLSGNDTIISQGTTGRVLNGYAGIDAIVGGSGKDRIDGGLGADSAYGGAGDDIFIVDSAADKVYELVNGGLDIIGAKVSYALQAGSYVEEIHAAATGAINLTGNSFANKLYGNPYANILNGGVGADTMEGFAGNDIYYIDNVGDKVIEAPVPGIDTIRTTITYVLTNAITVETLQAIGVANINLTGNFFNNTLIGNAGNNRLDGNVGADTMSGGAGKDLYIVESVGDVVSELGGSGIDTVNSSITFSLANAATTKGAVENLTLTGGFAINGTGNTLNNVIIGNLKNNILEGGAGVDTLNGGPGNDKLGGGLGNDASTGGVGNDIFVFNTALNAVTNKDAITDFANVTNNNDTFHLENAVFTKLTAAGALNGLSFKAGAAAADANDFIVYNRTTGALFYDVNGNGAGGAIQFATLLNKPVLTAADFVVI